MGRDPALGGRGGRAGVGACVAGALLLAGFALQAGIAARRDSVTIDEFVHLPVGLYVWRSGDTALDPINPPGRAIFALPFLADGPELPAGPQHRVWQLGGAFMERNASRYQALYVRARSVTLALALLLAGVVAAWSAELYGRGAALAALLLYALAPELLAHGHLVTLDLPGALGFTATLYLFWRFLAHPGPARALAVGVCAGLAVLCKLSAALVGPAMLACAAIHAVRRRHALDWRRFAGGLATLVAAALLVVNCGYGFAGTLRPLSEASFLLGGRLDGLQAWLPGLRLPLPLPLLEGIDQALNVAVARRETFYLLGELSHAPWWHYHLVAFAVKTPLPLLLLALLAFGRWLAGRGQGRDEHCLFVPLLLLFAANARGNSMDIGVRHVLAATPLLLVAISPLVSAALRPLRQPRPVRRLRPAALGMVVLLLWLAFGTLRVGPRYLQYFNELAGGPLGGHRVLIDSNLDWGQDLIRLREYMQARGLESVRLAYFGRADPRLYGVRFQPLERDARDGVAVVSPSLLMGRPYYWIWQGRRGLVPSEAYAWLRERPPVDRVGALFVYDLP